MSNVCFDPADFAEVKVPNDLLNRPLPADFDRCAVISITITDDDGMRVHGSFPKEKFWEVVAQLLNDHHGNINWMPWRLDCYARPNRPKLGFFPMSRLNSQ